MQIVRDLTSVRLKTPSYVTVGVFDGVHRGHQELLTAMVDAARRKEALSIAYTFDPHPSVALGREPVPLLTTIAERAELLETLGLDYLIAPPFTVKTTRMSASDFVEVLIERLGLTQLWAGPDFGLGHNRQGTVPFLSQLGLERGFTVRVVQGLICRGAPVSSSRIRAVLSEGDLAQATECLGRPYCLRGAIGRRQSQSTYLTGYSLHNVIALASRLVPGSGVYACAVHVENDQPATAVAYVVNKDSREAIPPSLICVLPDRETPVRMQSVSIDFIERLRPMREDSSSWMAPTTVSDDLALAQRILDEPRT